ncbi:tetratricopeptide repeat protein [Caulobacter sp. RHG1]|uniref:tetratricopeptide repeat protein n=1 Tax=Caulobacter sp. (strain RHG1) TaxID=2545762 RepID=UPI001554ED3E|nr:tetratricopeptide repeat protein [Caulobacter sp. RHG1]NQE63738.1 TPR repeat, SEL1 subfamily [Caulobacter sp. RHG1]
MSAFSFPIRTLVAEDVATLMSGSPEVARATASDLAVKGSAAAQALLGQMLLDAFGGPADPAAALGWFRKAAEAGEPMALNMVGRCHENGWGVAADIVIAADWYRRAAEQGGDWGMYNHATRLMLGDAGPVDRAGALAWFQKAAALGHAKSINVLGGFYEDGWEVERDLAQAKECYQRAADGGDFRGHFNLGRALASEGDISGALARFEAAATTATPAFIAKMVALLRTAPIDAYRALAERLAAG